MNALQKITKRAKQLRRIHPKLSQADAVKKASADYRAGRLGAVPGKKKKPASRQTGTSDKYADIRRKAKPPGKRRSASGSTYTERRKNRSDMPGKLTGTGSSGLQRATLGQLQSAARKKLMDQLNNLVVRKYHAKTVRETRQLQREISAIKRKLQQWK